MSVVNQPAQELTDQELEERAKLCFDLEQNVKAALQKGRQALWETAEALHKFDAENAWGPLGYENLSQWLADPEISMTSGTFYRLVSVHRKLIVQRKMQPEKVRGLELSKVAIVLPSIEKGKALLSEALGDVEKLGAKDLRDKYVKSDFDPAVTASEEDEQAEPEPEPESESEPDDDDVIEGRAIEPVDDAEDEMPTEVEWDDINERRKTRRQNLQKYIAGHTNWYPLEGVDGSAREHWRVPAEPPFNVEEAWATMLGELRSAADSGASQPRIPREVIIDGLRAWDSMRLPVP
jgi:hypothetical protein